MAQCPVCQRLSDVSPNCDAIVCPEHGVITGWQVYHWRDLEPEKFLAKLKEERSG